MAFVKKINDSVGNSMNRCIQCGTCSAVCSLTPPFAPFPRKEMARATLGMKHELICDLDIWLCYQCNDCSKSCPRSARPGEVLAAIRKESIRHFAFPGFLSRWFSRPCFLPILIFSPAAALGLTVMFKDQLARALNINNAIGDEIVYSHSAFLPHWLINLFFSTLSALVALVTTINVIRFWRAMKVRAVQSRQYKRARSIPSGVAVAIKRSVMHDQFGLCDVAHSRQVSHFCIFFGFLALLTVTSWVITSGWNPLLNSSFVYPFTFFSPWKTLANVGGVSLLSGCIAMISTRLRKSEESARSTYFDWLFLIVLSLTAATGFATEGLHYLRLEPHRHLIYFIHLVAVAVLLTSLPFTKFAHAVYRTAAIVFASHIGRIEDTEE